MKCFAPILVLCGVISATAAADQTCKAKATGQKLAGEALISFVKKCEADVHISPNSGDVGQKGAEASDCPLFSVLSMLDKCGRFHGRVHRQLRQASLGH